MTPDLPAREVCSHATLRALSGGVCPVCPGPQPAGGSGLPPVLGHSTASVITDEAAPRQASVLTDAAGTEHGGAILGSGLEHDAAAGHLEVRPRKVRAPRAKRRVKELEHREITSEPPAEERVEHLDPLLKPLDDMRGQGDGHVETYARHEASGHKVAELVTSALEDIHIVDNPLAGSLENNAPDTAELEDGGTKELASGSVNDSGEPGTWRDGGRALLTRGDGGEQGDPAGTSTRGTWGHTGHERRKEYQCSQCGAFGHNARSCGRDPIPRHPNDLDPLPPIDPALALRSPDMMRRVLEALRARRLRESFADFVQEAWNIVEPARPLAPSVAVEAMCAGLQAVADGRIHSLAIALPPGTGKSIIGSVLFPAWILLRSNGTKRLMCGGYSWDFAKRDSRRTRDLVASKWYQALVGGGWSLREDADKVEDFWSTAGGRRLITSVGGRGIGERVDGQIFDDVLNSSDVHSVAAKKDARHWLTTVMPSRLDDAAHAWRVLIGQRLCVDDPTAVFLEMGALLLRLTAFAGEEPAELLDDQGVLVWRDKRAKGEPLFADLSKEAIDQMGLTANARKAQYDQDPQSDDGATIKRVWWKFHGAGPRPAGCDEETPAVIAPARFDRIVVSVDLTFGSLDGSYAAMQAWGGTGKDRYLLRAWRKQCGTLEQDAVVASLAAAYPSAKIMIETKAHGPAAIERLQALGIAGVVGMPALGSKRERLGLVEATVQSGCCFLPLDPSAFTGDGTLADFVEELAGATKHDDQQDSFAYAVHELNVRAAEQSPEARNKALTHGMLQLAGRLRRRR